MQSISVASYPNYQVGRFDNLNFKKYHDGNEAWLHKPEAATEHISKILPSHIDTVLIFGCSSGRDFIPFQSTHKCLGLDIAPVGAIKWVCDTTNLTYVECSIEDFITNIDIFQLDWHNTFVYASGTLMYATPEVQNQLVDVLLEKGCNNMLFQEYEPGNSGVHPCLDFNEVNLAKFKKKLFRETHYHQPMAHILMEIDV